MDAERYQVYRQWKGLPRELIASDMSLDNAVLFMGAWFNANYNDQETALIISRQQIDYHVKEVCEA